MKDLNDIVIYTKSLHTYNNNKYCDNIGKVFIIEYYHSINNESRCNNCHFGKSEYNTHGCSCPITQTGSCALLPSRIYIDITDKL